MARKIAKDVIYQEWTFEGLKKPIYKIYAWGSYAGQSPVWWRSYMNSAHRQSSTTFWTA